MARAPHQHLFQKKVKRRSRSTAALLHRKGSISNPHKKHKKSTDLLFIMSKE